MKLILALCVIFAIANADWATSKIYAASDCSGDFSYASAVSSPICTTVTCAAGVSLTCGTAVPTFADSIAYTLFTDLKCKEGTESAIVAVGPGQDGKCVGSVGLSYKFSTSGKNCNYAAYTTGDCSGTATASYTYKSGTCENGVQLTCGAGILSASIALLLLAIGVFLF
eukprot:TRINITY_DN753_c0_g1_i2.p2 TRINITY_DN753_c0_g1~~TRINITY_DN753_c0_g1_i2.p2  ORF type:complete len:169 (-),score=62.28 TRINITY_DN753_c0_g1_i2:58-564(-)